MHHVGGSDMKNFFVKREEELFLRRFDRCREQIREAKQTPHQHVVRKHVVFHTTTTTMPETRQSRKRKSIKQAASSPKKARPPRRANASVRHDDENSRDTKVSESVPLVVCGTSGYSYAHWKGVYYPRGAKQWDHYSAEFHAVELNATFYKWQSEKTWNSWRNQVEGKPFIYAVKAHQYFTHWKCLKMDEAFVNKFQTFIGDCHRLGPHLGPILFQFPARFVCNEVTLARLEEFGQLVDRINSEQDWQLRVALEFRNKSWFCQQVYNTVRAHNICICLVNLVNKNPAKWADDMVSGFSPPLDGYAFDACDWGTYLRFHGTAGQYEGSYSDKVLDDMLARSRKARGDVFVFFNNTDDGDPPSAIRDARYVCQAAKKVTA